MARIVLPIAGAVVGYFIGGPLGAQIGFALGSVAGTIVDPVRVQGPRLEDLKVQGSSYGAPIPILYGTMRVAGQMIWTTDLQETQHEEGGKGGPQATTYSYSVSCAIGICEGPIAGIRRIWGDNKLVFDASDPSVGIRAGLNFIERIYDHISVQMGKPGLANAMGVYLGDETQLPDPTMEAYLGAGRVPAHRGMAYVVFANLPLESFGNRIPNFTFEVVSEGADAPVFTTWNLGYGLLRGWEDGQMLVACAMNSYPLALIDPATGSRTDIGAGYEARSISAVVDDRIWAETYHATYGYGLTLYSLSARRILTSFDDGYGTGTPVLAGGVVWTHGNYGLCPRDAGNGALFRNDAGNVLYIGNCLAYPGINAVGGITVLPDASIVVWQPYPGMVGRAYLQAGAPVAEWWDWLPAGVNWQDCTYVPETNELWLIRNDNSNLVIADLDARTYTEQAQIGAYGYYSYAPGIGLVKTQQSGQTLYLIDAPNRTIRNSFTMPNNGEYYNAAALGSRLYLATTDSASVGNLTRASFGILTPGTVSLATVLSDLHARSGLDPSQLDAAAVSDTVAGYAVTNRMPIRAAIEPLRAAYFLDAVESDGKIRYSRRGAAPVASIPYADLAAHEGGAALPSPLASTRAQEIDLPATVDVGYLNPATNYEQGNQRARRVTTSSREAVSISLPIVLSDDQARQIAEAMLYNAWAGRTSIRFAVGQQYAQLDPGDVVSIDTPDASLRLLITSTSYARPGVLTVTAVQEDATVYQQTATGAPAPATTDRIPVITGTRLELLDIPILRDSDDDGGFYAAASGFNADWPGARLYKSSDSTNYSAVTDLLGSVIGTATSVLASGITTTWDRVNSVTVALLSGTLAGNTELAVLNGANAALLGNEIIQFQSATQNADGTWTLSTLLRGRRGTEWAAGSHRSGERFVLLSGNLRRVAGEYQLSRQYKGVTYGKSLSSASDQAFALQSIGLKPFAPVHLRGSRDASSNLTITWVRRTRVQGDWRDYTDVPIGEASERYEIDILSGTTVKRTLTATSPSVVYAAADQTTDFGSAQASISVKIYQLSDRVGRGYAAAASV